MVGDDTTVLVADDDAAVRELHERWLAEEYAVRTAENGRRTVEAVDEDVDVVLLDRDMPGLNGVQVAERIRTAGHDCHLVMVSAMAADFDIVDHPLDDYVRKPVSQADLLAAVERHEEQLAYRAALDEYFELSAKLARIEADADEGALAGDPEYERLRGRVAEVAARVDEALTSETADWSVAFQTAPRAGIGEVDPSGNSRGRPGSAG